MYKLLTTAAVIMAVATPSIANEWTGAKNLTNDLNTIYGALDGQDEFNNLQGDFSGNDGQLADFFSEVDKGVTYLTLNVDNDNIITVGINEGSTFDEIEAKQTSLINRINYDLFHQTEDGQGTVTSTFDPDGTYGIATGNPINASEDPVNSNNVYTEGSDTGLLGVKVAGLVDDVNTINTYLVAPGRKKSESDIFIAEFNGGAGNSSGVEVADVNTTITNLNLANTTARDSNGVFFGNTQLEGFTADGVNNYRIPAFNSFNDIGNGTAAAGGYNSISDWANEIQTVVTTAGTATIIGTGVVAIVDSAAGTITVDGVPYTFADGAFVAD